MRIPALAFATPLVALLVSAPAHAAPENAGRRGVFLGGGGGVITGTAEDEDGRDTGSFTGAGGHLRFGEEVIAGLTIGLEFLGGSGSGHNDRFEAGVGGFVLQVSWRPFDSPEGLVFLGGTGVGGGGITPTEDGDFEGSSAGAIHQLGVIYEFFPYRDGDGGLAIAPAARWFILPTSADGKVWFNDFIVGVDTVWYFGRD
ncbi:MAG: hypothetical protein KC620_09400 [Myxococcales bacterium]|nr:hypothetical protein [Myxococcales bacterium]